MGRLKTKIASNPLGSRYLSDAAFRTHISLFVTFGANLLYVGMNLLSYLLYRSAWFMILSCYYIILAVMRFLLFKYLRNNRIGKNRLGEFKRARLCAAILLTVNFALSGGVLMILYQNKGFEYNGILIYAIALYTFYITTHAIVSLVKYRKYKSPVMTVSKIVSLSAALVSMLSLETAMLSQFGSDMPSETKSLFVALSGAAISITVISMSVCMIYNSSKEIKTIRRNYGKQIL